MKNDYLETLRRFLPEEVFESSQASCREKRKSVSFRKEKNDSVHYFAINACQDWPEGERSCDGLFVCTQEGRYDLLVVLVELKGDDTKSALDQIEKTAEKLCAKSRRGVRFAGHGKEDQPAKPGAYHHNKFVIGVVAAPSGGNAAPSWQLKQKQLRQKSIILLDRQPPNTTFTVTQLYRLAGIKV